MSFALGEGLLMALLFRPDAARLGPEVGVKLPKVCATLRLSVIGGGPSVLWYTAKGTASLLVPLSSILAAAPGGWNTVFLLAASLNVAAAVMALAVLKPMRRNLMAVAKLGDRPELTSRRRTNGPSTSREGPAP